MISYEESIEIINKIPFSSIRTERVFLIDAIDRILAQDIIASEDYPVYPTSSMDGYAVCFDDLSVGNKIVILGDNPAGAEVVESVTPGKCIKTFTGSLLPSGADTLIPIENVTVLENTIQINTLVPKGFAIRPVGESYRKFEILIPKGTKLGFAEIGVLAGINQVMIDVVVKPRVAILATGSEILDIGESAHHIGQIRSSNNYTLQALMVKAGAQPIQMGIVQDDYNDIVSRFKEALRSSDMIITTGGVSVGDYDFVKDIIPSLGATVLFKGVLIKPGQHVMVAQLEEKFIIALPGFAYSSTVTAILYAFPLLAKMMGLESGFDIVKAKLRTPVKKSSQKTEFVACNLTYSDGLYWCDFDGKKSGSSAILTNLLGDAGLMVTEPGNIEFSAGESVSVIKL